MSVSPQSLARTRDKRSLKVPARFNDTVYTLKEATEVLRTSTRSRPGSLGPKREHEDSVEEKEEVQPKALKGQSFKPSVTCKKPTKQGGDAEETVTPARPLVEQIPNSPTTPPPSTTPSPITVSTAPTATAQVEREFCAKKESSSSLSTKKKLNKGFSLIVKQQQQQNQQSVKLPDEKIKPATPRQAPTAKISGGVSNFNIHQTSQPLTTVTGTTPIIIPSAQTTTPLQHGLGQRYFNNLTTNHPQYGARLLINEPLYLPRSVGTIAPITTTLPQIAIQARRPPFVSRIAEACLAYQDERKFNYITSNHAALIKITRHLGVTDRLNLRCVNRTWKSIIESQSVWKKTLINTGDANLNWTSLIEKYLNRYETTEIIFDEFVGSVDQCAYPPTSLGHILRTKVPSLRSLWIRSVNDVQNSVAYNILDGVLRRQDKVTNSFIRFEWQVKVGIDPLGIATVELIADKIASEHLSNSYETNVDENHDGDDKTKTIVGLYDLKQKFEKAEAETHHQSVDSCIEFTIKPI